MRFGIPTPKGTHLKQQAPAGEPVFTPMPRPGRPGFLSFESILGFLSLLPWLGRRRKRQQAELAQDQRSQSIKAKGMR
jgi:hypothetical protein